MYLNLLLFAYTLNQLIRLSHNSVVSSGHGHPQALRTEGLQAGCHEGEMACRCLHGCEHATICANWFKRVYQECPRNKLVCQGASSSSVATDIHEPHLKHFFFPKISDNQHCTLWLQDAHVATAAASAQHHLMDAGFCK